MNHPTLFDRVFTESEKPTFLDSVHGAVKAADISDPTHPLHRFFSKLGELGHALKSHGGSTHGSMNLVQTHSPSRASAPPARQVLRSLKHDVKDVTRSRARASKEGATLRAMGRVQPGTGPRRQPAQQRRRGVPGMEPPIR